MTGIHKLLYHLGMLPFTPRNIQRWKKDQAVSTLEFGLNHGIYNIRILCLEALADIPNYPKEERLVPFVDDPIRVVSECAMQLLEHCSSHPEIIEKIALKKAYWAAQSHFNTTAKDTKHTYTRKTSYFKPSSFFSRERPSDRAHKKLKNHQETNNPGA